MAEEQNKINLYLMTLKGYNVLINLNRNYHENINKVIIGKDKNLIKDYSSEIASFCLENNINYVYRENSEELPNKKILSISISWRWLIPNTENLIVIHDSLLPKYRGFAPLVNMLVNEETKIGVTAIFASSEFDRGNIIANKKKSIRYPIKIEKAIHEIGTCYTEIVDYIFKKVKNGKTIKSRQQNEHLSSYSVWLDEEDYFIDWSKDAHEIKRFIDALSFPYAGAKTTLENRELVILDSEVIKDENIINRERHIGKQIFLIKNNPIIICGKGLLKINNAHWRDNNENALPFSKFRIRLK